MLSPAIRAMDGTTGLATLRTRKDKVNWQCTDRGKIDPCRASVVLQGDTFTPGQTAHNHAPKPGISIAVEIQAKILRAVARALPSMRLEKVVVDFEPAMWMAIEAVFPEVHIQRCVFHWAQAVNRKGNSVQTRESRPRLCEAVDSFALLASYGHPSRISHAATTCLVSSSCPAM
ncbi:uncharacterized protein LOC117336522 [Pecten maximus]|uniref:uncharacterized protein LOC117336522 n=1 Tax=Pecten maximus TaxID=6579 RepID=UPI00145831C8|nr:uncharacterized protein LOC117336522 [Pecten maximus]